MSATCQIIDNFSKGAKNYERLACVQKFCALELGRFLQNCKRDLVEGDILEIGCGTGFISRQLLNSFPGRNIRITDISSAMLEKCRENLGKCNAQLSLLDGEKFTEKNRYSLIISGLTFQWFNNFQLSTRALLDGLKRGGVLLFSFLERKSFPEWQLACLELDLPFTANQLPSLEDVRSISQTVSSISYIWEEQITLIYPSALHCLKSIKQIGAGASLKQTSLSLSEMRNLLRCWDNQFPNGVAMTYNVANVAMQRC